ncbi:hypothetical protein BDW72DRAFT_164641 [Aspergillus terricola var. indicus]
MSVNIGLWLFPSYTAQHLLDRDEREKSLSVHHQRCQLPEPMWLGSIMSVVLSNSKAVSAIMSENSAEGLL